MLSRSCCLSDINYFVQGQLETCPHHLSQALQQVSTFLDTRHSRGMWLNTRIGKCPQFPGFFFPGPVVVYEQVLCDWFYKATGTRHNCLNFQASYRGEFLATFSSVKALLSTKLHIVIELYHALQIEELS